MDIFFSLYFTICNEKYIFINLLLVIGLTTSQIVTRNLCPINDGSGSC